MKADILQILHEEAMTQYNPDGKDEIVVYSDEFETVANQIINIFNEELSVKNKEIERYRNALESIREPFSDAFITRILNNEE